MLQRRTFNPCIKESPSARHINSSFHSHGFAIIMYPPGCAVVLYGKKVVVFKKPFRDRGGLRISGYAKR